MITIDPGKVKDGKEYIQALDISLKKDGEMYLSMFLRFCCEVHVFKIKNNKFDEYTFRQTIATEWINDIAFCDNNVFVCFENNTIGRLYPNDLDEDEDEYMEEDYEDEEEIEE